MSIHLLTSKDTLTHKYFLFPGVFEHQFYTQSNLKLFVDVWRATAATRAKLQILTKNFNFHIWGNGGSVTLPETGSHCPRTHSSGHAAPPFPSKQVMEIMEKLEEHSNFQLQKKLVFFSQVKVNSNLDLDFYRSSYLQKLRYFFPAESKIFFSSSSVFYNMYREYNYLFCQWIPVSVYVCLRCFRHVLVIWENIEAGQLWDTLQSE